MLIFLSALFNLSACLLARARLKTWLNPFSVVNALFFLAGICTLISPFAESSAWASIIAAETKLYIFLISVGLLLVTFFLKNAGWQLESHAVGVPILLKAMLWGCFSIVLVVTVVHYIKLKSLPLFLISDSFASGRGATYDEFQMSFITSLMWGAARFMAIILAFDFISGRLNILEHIKLHKIGYTLTIMATLLSLGAGMRNVLVWPFVFYLFGMSRKTIISGKILMLFSCLTFLGGVFFLLIGNYRLGAAGFENDLFDQLTRYDISNPLIKNILGWFFSYSGTGYYNLNAIIIDPPALGHGSILLSAMIPNSILEHLGFNVPDPAIIYLTENNYLPYSGFTFRTIFTDLYADFGYWGSICAGVSLYGLMVFLYNKAGESAGCCLLYLCMLPGCLMFPFLDFYTGMSALLPILLSFIYLISFRCFRFRVGFLPGRGPGGAGN